MILLAETPRWYGSARCPTCQRPMLCTPDSQVCEVGHYVHVELPQPTLGELFGLYGQPWGQLLSPHSHSLAAGWRTSHMPSAGRER